MNPEHIAALVSTATISLLHTLLPSHWLCFSLVGRAQGWKLRKTLGITALAGGAHVLSTIALGILMILLGSTLIPEESTVIVSSILLMAMGALFLLMQVLRKGHKHEHDMNRLAIVALILTPTISPCSAVIPMFLVVAGGGVLLIVLVSTILLVSTVGTMLLLVSLSSMGVEKMKFGFIDRYEKAIVGVILCGLGLLILVLHQTHAH